MSGLFGKTPKPADPTPMPVPDDAAAKAADLRQRQLAANRTGRAQTILTNRAQRGGDAGTQAFNNSLLGQAG